MVVPSLLRLCIYSTHPDGTVVSTFCVTCTPGVSSHPCKPQTSDPRTPRVGRYRKNDGWLTDGKIRLQQRDVGPLQRNSRLKSILRPPLTTQRSWDWEGHPRGYE